MKEKPILFSGPMVNAIREGRKTQTRRVVKLPAGYTHQNVDLTRLQDGFPDGTRPVFGDCDCEPNAFSVRNPYGQTGDRLWVRETWAPNTGDVLTGKAYYKVDGKVIAPRWHPSTHMPNWASRFTVTLDVGIQTWDRNGYFWKITCTLKK